MRDRSVRPLPVGISEVRLDPAIPAGSLAATIDLGCDAGVAMIIDGTVLPWQ